jgi:hypothetical protein
MHPRQTFKKVAADTFNRMGIRLKHG